MLRIADAAVEFAVGRGRAAHAHVEPGLTIDVTGHACRPALRLEWAAPRDLALTAGTNVLAYVRIETSWEEVTWLAAHPSPGVLDPIAATSFRSVAGGAEDHGWWRAWMVRYLGSLEASPVSPLYDGRWAMARVPYRASSDAPFYPRDPRMGMALAPPPAHRAERVVAPMRLRHDDWLAGWSDDPVPRGVLWPLRPASPSTAGRIKAWRKHAARATLPPIVLLYVSVLGAYVVCDGHDRLHAALLEGVPPPLLAFWPVGRSALPATRAYRFPGGYPAWTGAVQALLRAWPDVDAAARAWLLDGVSSPVPPAPAERAPRRRKAYR